MKNLFMSLWLSQANRYAGRIRGFWAGETKRQTRTMVKAVTGTKTAKLQTKRKKR